MLLELRLRQLICFEKLTQNFEIGRHFRVDINFCVFFCVFSYTQNIIIKNKNLETKLQHS